MLARTGMQYNTKQVYLNIPIFLLKTDILILSFQNIHFQAGKPTPPLLSPLPPHDVLAVFPWHNL